MKRVTGGRWMLALALSAAACAGEDEPELEGKQQSLLSATTASEETFAAFESGQVRPLAISADGNYVYALNTPDNRLEIYRAQAGVLTSIASLMVGLEPVALAVRSTGELWVVNHLSDSVSIVDISTPA